MNTRLSRRKLALYVADGIAVDGELSRRIEEVAAYLIDSKRLREAELVVRAIEDALVEAGTVVTTVTTSGPLIEDMTDAIKKLTGAHSVAIRERVDPQLLGGVIIETPGQMLDASVRSKLMALRRAKL